MIETIFNAWVDFYSRCVGFLFTETFGYPFPIGYLFIVVFVFGIFMDYLILKA